MKSTYEPDCQWGIGVMVASVLSGLFGLLIVAIGGFMGFVAREQGPINTPDFPASAPFSFFAIFAAVIGVVTVLAAAAQFVGGMGMYRGQRWGFTTVAITSGVAILHGLVSLPAGTLTIVVHGFFLNYCWKRLQGDRVPLPPPPPLR